MQEQIKQVASRIRELREIFGASVEELARAFQVPEADYRQYESGTVDIPVGILYQIAQRFGVELTTLLTGEEPRLRTYALTRAGQGVSVDRRQQYGYQSLAYNFIGKRSEPFMVTVPPAADDAPEHINSHPGQEFHYVLEGTLRVRLLPGSGPELLAGSVEGTLEGQGRPVAAVGGKDVVVHVQVGERVLLVVASALTESRATPETNRPSSKGTSATVATGAPRKRVLSVRGLAVRKLQGKYLGTLRGLRPGARARVKKVAREQGVAAAVRLAQSLK